MQMICKTKLDTIFMFCKSLHWNKFTANVFGKLWCFKTYWSLWLYVVLWSHVDNWCAIIRSIKNSKLLLIQYGLGTLLPGSWISVDYVSPYETKSDTVKRKRDIKQFSWACTSAAYGSCFCICILLNLRVYGIKPGT